MALCACPWAAAGEALTCEVALPESHVMAERSSTIAALETLPDACLKTLTMRCSDSAARDFMDLGNAAMCSMGYEALLRKSFAGDFHAFLEWWRSERAEAAR
jgi:hypothetical protein